MPLKKSVTLQTIAEALGLTSHTVSKALRGLPGMSEETRKLVLDTARKLQYQTRNQQNSLAVDRIPVLRSKPFRFLFILGSDGQMAITQQLLLGIQSRLSELGHKLEAVAVADNTDADDTLRLWMENHELLYADGLFLPPGLSFELERKLLDFNMPKTIVNFPPLDVKADSVIWDVASAMYQSVRHFHMMGHRNIMYIGSLSPLRGFWMRWNAFNEAMRLNGLKIDPAMHMIEPIEKGEEWFQVLSEKLTVYKPTALLCGLSANVAMVYYTCAQLGKQIPDDYSLITLETLKHEFISELSRPVLPVKETCDRAVDRMLWRIGNPNAPFEHIRIQGHFHEGSTVRALEVSEPVYPS
jgi:LacI family transcriptional regulator